MRRSYALLLSLSLTGALLGCHGHSGDDAKATTPQPATLTGVYSGELPCSNCKTIAATLWMRPDERFVLQQEYVADNGVADGRTFALGRWSWDEHAAEVVLRGVGPERRLVPGDEQHLKLRAVSSVEHQLQRNAESPPFVERLRLDGITTNVDNGGTFAECITGLELPIAGGTGFAQLRRQQRQVNARGKPALTAVEAHIAMAGDGDAAHETLVVDRFITLKPGAGC